MLTFLVEANTFYLSSFITGFCILKGDREIYMDMEKTFKRKRITLNVKVENLSFNDIRLPIKLIPSPNLKM